MYALSLFIKYRSRAYILAPRHDRVS